MPPLFRKAPSLQRFRPFGGGGGKPADIASDGKRPLSFALHFAFGEAQAPRGEAAEGVGRRPQGPFASPSAKPKAASALARRPFRGTGSLREHKPPAQGICNGPCWTALRPSWTPFDFGEEANKALYGAEEGPKEA